MNESRIYQYYDCDYCTLRKRRREVLLNGGIMTMTPSPYGIVLSADSAKSSSTTFLVKGFPLKCVCGRNQEKIHTLQELVDIIDTMIKRQLRH